MARTVTFLQLAPEFGGTRFGPFEVPEVRLGGDPGANDITLPESLGVAPQHVKLLRQQDNSFILAPVDRSAPIFHFKGGGGRPKQVTAPTAVSSGDAFALVTPEGPRFIIVVENDARAIKEAAQEAVGPDWLKKIQPRAGKFREGLWREIKRRGIASVFASRIGNFVMRFGTMVRTGAIFSPIYIVSGMLMLGGWLFAGGAACSAFRISGSRSAAVSDLTTCQDQLGTKITDGDSGDPTVPELGKAVLADETWAITLENDPDLRDAFARRLRDLFGQPELYKHIYQKQGTSYAQFRKALEGAGFEDPVIRVLAFASAPPVTDRLWSRVANSDEKEVCGRGPLDLTYRQGRNLGLASLQPDALVENDVATTNDLAKQREALQATVSEAGATFEFNDDLIRGVDSQVQGGQTCLFVDGTDDRDSPQAVARALRSVLGRKVPKVDQQYWIVARLFRLYLAEFRSADFEELVLDANDPPSAALRRQNVLDTRTRYAIDRTATVMARAVAIPCLARLSAKKGVTIPDWFLAEPPLLGQCAILKAYVELDNL